MRWLIRKIKDKHAKIDLSRADGLGKFDLARLVGNFELRELELKITRINFENPSHELTAILYHDTIAAFRRRFLKEIEGLFVQVLMVAREMGVLQMGTVALDSTQRFLIAGPA